MTNAVDEIKSLFDEQMGIFEHFKSENARFGKRIDAVEKTVLDVAKMANRPGGLMANIGSSLDEEKKGAEWFNDQMRTAYLVKGQAPPADVSADQIAEYKTAFMSYLRKGQVETWSEPERKMMQVGSDPSGGYLVPPDLGGRIVSRIFQISPLRQLASVQSIGSDALEGISDPNEVGGGWVSELGDRNETDTSDLGKYRIPVHEVYAMPVCTQKVLDDSAINLEDYVSRKVANKLGRLESEAFATGNGVGRPRGYTTYTTEATHDESRSWGVLEHVVSGTNGSFGTDPNGANKLIDLVHTVKPEYRRNAVFTMNRTTLGQVRKLKDGDTPGRYVFIESANANMPGTLLGYPIVEDPFMPDYSTTGALAIAFGDFSETYQICDRIGIRMIRDNVTTKGRVKFYTWARVGGDVIGWDSLKFLKMST